MLRLRDISTRCAVVLALLLCAPATALAASAGSQQYTDPLAGSGTNSSSHNSSPSNSSSSGSSSSSPSSGSSSSGSGSSSGSAVSGTQSGTSQGGTGSSSSNTASGTSANGTGTSASTSGTLPYTGFDTFISAGLGLMLLGGGLALRRALRRA